MGTCESREDSLSVSAKKGNQEPSSPQNKEDLKSDESVIKLKRSNYDPSDFVQYYDHIKKLLKEKKYKFSNPGDKATFQMRLATSNGLDKETARVWIHMYVDYMILVAWWKEHAKRTRIIYPPYAIQQVARLHAVFTKSYLRFCRIITEGRRLIKLAPIKVIAQQDTAVTYEALKNGYYSGMHFIWQRIYSNGNLGKSDEVRKQAEEIWEPFDQTLFKSEFNFSFCDPEKSKEFANMLADNQKDIALKSKNNKDIIDVGKTLRGILEIGDLMKGSDQVKPTLMDQFKIATDKLDADAVSMVEEASFTGEFVNLLAWENRISIETAKKWILEYKKFLFLSYIHRQRYPIIPSEIVDQVWHLHLQFVHTYQQDIHKKQEFHHNPWKAGEEDMHKQRALYKETLYLYNQNFGTPDAEIWPDDNIKFHELATTRNYGMFFARKLVVIDEKFKSLAMTRSVKFYKSSSTPSTMLSSGMSLSMSSPMTPAGTSEIALLFLDQS